MLGHFKKRGESWYFWVELERGADGKRHQLSRGGFRTRKQAEKAYAEVRDQLRQDSFITPTEDDRRSVPGRRVAPAVRASIRPGTHDHYSKMVHGYVVPRIGGLKLGDLTPGQLNAFYGGTSSLMAGFTGSITAGRSESETSPRSHSPAQTSRRRSSLGQPRSQSCGSGGATASAHSRDEGLGPHQAGAGS